MKATLQRTPLLQQRGSFSTAFSPKHLITSDLPNDDRPMIRAFGADDIKQLYTAIVQKPTFSDER